MKFKVVCNYNSDYNIYQIVNDIWNIDNKYELTYGEDYDILIIFNSNLNRHINVPIQNVFGFIQEPTWSNFFDKNLPNICNTVFYHNPSIFNNSNVVENNSIMLHHVWDKPMRGEIQWKENNTKKLIESNFPKERKLSIIVSNKENNPTYHYRQRLVRLLLESDLEFDMFGLDWNLTDKRYKGYISNKIEGLKDYKFSICIENCIEENYITEKFFDAILCGTIPIYHGSRNIEKYYPNSYEYLDISKDNVIERIREILNMDKEYDIYNSKLRYINEYNPFYIINKKLKL